MAVAFTVALVTAAPAGTRHVWPVPGNWEGYSGAHPFSMMIVRHGSRYVIHDMVLEVPSGCRNRGDTSFGLLTFSAFGSLTPRGQFGRAPSRGASGLGGRFSSKWRASAGYRRAIGAKRGRCDSGAFHWLLRPVARAPVDDGAWHGTTGDGHPVSFSLAFGGRELNALHGEVVAQCSGSGSQTGDFSYGFFFVPANGSFSQDFSPVPHVHVHVTGTFASPTSARGTFHVDGLCAPVDATWTAARG